ncbi:MAG: sulfate adenylyltransferase subunit 1 [Deltaproteobacteria bacterium]
MAQSETIKLVIVGHIDHGKSTLIGRILYDTHSLVPDKIAEIERASREAGLDTLELAFALDHLREEREQGITIDTSQIFFRTDKREYVIIDAPGHVEFMKNMITGASQADAAVVIVDASRGIQEQTRRHLVTVSLLGIERIIVAVNKMDLIGYEEPSFSRLSGEITDFLATLEIAPAAVIPVSAARGDNVVSPSARMPWYNGPDMVRCLDSLVPPVSTANEPLAFCAQDIYRDRDRRIVVGRVENGTVRAGSTIKILPSAITTRVKSIEKFLEEKEIAEAGECIGLTTEDDVFLERGLVICEEGKEPFLGDTFTANIFWIGRQTHKKGEKITLRLTTQETTAVIETIHKRIDSETWALLNTDADELGFLEIGEVTLRCKKQVIFNLFKRSKEMGRFVLMKDGTICAGGIVTKVARRPAPSPVKSFYDRNNGHTPGVAVR